MADRCIGGMAGLNWDRAAWGRFFAESGPDPIWDDPGVEPRPRKRPSPGDLARMRDERALAELRRRDLWDLENRVRRMSPAERRARRNSLRNMVARLTDSTPQFEKVWRERFQALVPDPAPREQAAVTAWRVSALIQEFPGRLTQQTAVQVLVGLDPSGLPPEILASRWWGACRGQDTAVIAERVAAAERGRFVRRRADRRLITSPRS